ncbi:MAG: 16S rRNA (guanine(966)-N(2))-methyltransferase RsmD [Spirochaetes bacterium]|nr:16S rRNA (guanine(966)-N(2))-methyltransferase RsmD [Spirochaetota bacterium]
MAKMLRLSGGSFAGRRIRVPALGTRPATNRVREATFSVLRSFFENGVQGMCVLDLFAGSGSLGIEALSRGAERCTFVERDRAACECIRGNLKALGVTGEVVQSDVVRFLHRVRDIEYDLIFMDPPYRYDRMEKTVGLIRKAAAPAKSPVLSYERIFTPSLPEFGTGAELLTRKRYGQTEVLYYIIKKAEGEAK